MPTRLSPEMWAVLEAISAEEERSIAQVGMMLLREALVARGKWPPREGGGE
jgi:hypothetical protein